jgi:hypothetical protein
MYASSPSSSSSYLSGAGANAGASTFSLSLPPAPPPSTLSVKERLWLVFTYYAMMDNSLDPAHMTRHQLQKCARDARLIPPLLDADIENIWMAEVNREGKGLAGTEKPHNVLKQMPVRAAPARHDEPSRRSSDRRQVRERERESGEKCF